jgi:mannosyltransferase OCH1-like enzyme
VVHDWTTDQLPPLVNQAVFDDIGTPDPGERLHPISVAVQQADVVGYELIWRYGGLYVNCDIQPVRPLDGLLARVGEDAYACFEDENFLVNAAIGGPARHPFWKAVIDALPERYWARRRDQMNEVTGPHLLTQVWRSWEFDGFTALSRETFNPIHFHQVPLGGDADGLFQETSLPDQTIGVHHWGHRLTGRPNRVNEV